MGDNLGVGTVPEGSVRKSGTWLRVPAKLISVAGGYHLWSDTYDRELTDIFAIQDEIAGLMTLWRKPATLWSWIPTISPPVGRWCGRWPSLFTTMTRWQRQYRR